LNNNPDITDKIVKIINKMYDELFLLNNFNKIDVIFFNETIKYDINMDTYK
jgi:hypothetical protein